MLSFSQKSPVEYPAAGSIHPNAKYIDADELGPFIKGTAVIRKGNAEAMIDSAGAFVIGFNKYRIVMLPLRFTDGLSQGTLDIPGGNGIYIASPANVPLNTTHLINSKGKVIFTAPAGYEIVRHNVGHNAAMDAPVEGKLATIPKRTTDLTKFGDDIMVFPDGNVMRFPSFSDVHYSEGMLAWFDKATKKWGFKNVKGVTVIKPQYEYALSFSEGLVAVAKKDEFKEIKWGYINKKGVEVIPFKFSNQPGSFGNGLAWVEPKAGGENKYVFIDTTGEVKISIPVNSELRRSLFIGGQVDSKFSHGFLVLNKDYDKLMDIHEIVYDSKSIMRLFGLDESLKLQPYPFYNGWMYVLDSKRDGRKVGMINLADRSKVPPVFQSLSMFDPVSNLTYAKLKIDGEAGKGEKFVEGYVNREGVFVMVKKKGTEW